MPFLFVLVAGVVVGTPVNQSEVFDKVPIYDFPTALS